ncbi:MCE family protein [Nocardia wallacei]|uniref:MCE family protein n=1 Tax=Nocardia wallacei TaxID=480035 RepID=UPI0024577E29|nr:MCE family protein [Nocardia wallacei]
MNSIRSVFGTRIGRPALVLGALVAAAVVTLATVTAVNRSSVNHATAYFRNTTGLYIGDRVMILGVQVGSVDEIEPEGDKVRVRFTYDNSHPVPADAKAAIVAPTLVTGRYVQLAPAYQGGPTLADGATIPLERTAVPVEFDEVKKQIVKLTQDLGATPQNPDGSLNQFLTATAGALDGNGRTLHESLINLADAVHTLDQGGTDLFATVRNLQTFTTALATNDQRIRGFSGQLAALSGTLNDNRTELDALLTSMDTTFQEVTGFIQQNRAALKTDVNKLNTITGLLVDRQDALASILHTAPTGLSDLYNIYDAQSNSVTAAIAIADFPPDPKSLICALLTTANAPADECRRAGDAFTRSLADAATGKAPR